MVAPIFQKVKDKELVKRNNIFINPYVCVWKREKQYLKRYEQLSVTTKYKLPTL